MSRSYKKYPRVNVYYGSKSGKFGRRQANKKIRNLPMDISVPKGGTYKKLYESCNICDYSFTEFKEWAITRWEKEEKELLNDVRSWHHKHHQSLDEDLIDWYKTYKRK